MLFWLVVLLVITVVFSMFLGRYPNLGFISFQRLASDTLAQKLVFNLRVPRILTALLLGASLSAAGGVFQMIFSNQLFSFIKKLDYHISCVILNIDR